MDGVWPDDYALITRDSGPAGPESARYSGSCSVRPPSGVSHAARFTVSSHSTVPGEPGQRALDTLWPDRGDGSTGKTRAYQGAESWYRDMVLFPPGFEPTSDTDWNWVYQLHNFPDHVAVPNLSLSVVMDQSDRRRGPRNGARLSTRIIGGGSPAHPIDAIGSGGERLYTASTYRNNPEVCWDWIVGPELETGRWYEFVWQVRWDWRSTADGGSGLVRCLVDGALVGSYAGPTLFYYADRGGGRTGAGQAYLQHGYYRPTDAEAGYEQPTSTIYHAGTMIGPTAASIGVWPA